MITALSKRAFAIATLGVSISACNGLPDETNAPEHVASAQQSIISGYDATPLWPLCGRVAGAYNQTPVWTDGDPCPSTRQGVSYTDFPLAATYGPRSLAADDPEYDWHRGIDIQAVLGTPIFSVSDGVVDSISGSGNDRKLVMKHCRPGQETACYGSTYPAHGSSPSMSCSNNKCYYTVYDHASAILAPSEGMFLSKGTHVAKTGISNGNFPHLHFEVRSQRNFVADAIHPLSVLPYDALSTSNIAVSNMAATLNTDGTFTVGADVALSTPNNMPQKLDLQEVSVTAKVFSSYACVGGSAVPQYTNISQGSTQNGYLMHPGVFNFGVFNEMFSHRKSDNSTTPSRITSGGSDDPANCPFEADHEFLSGWTNRYYDWHLIKADPADTSGETGLFNGMQVLPLDHVNTTATVYSLHVAFQFVDTDGEDGEDAQVCFTMKATDLAGQYQTQSLCVGELPSPPGC